MYNLLQATMDLVFVILCIALIAFTFFAYTTHKKALDTGRCLSLCFNILEHLETLNISDLEADLVHLRSLYHIILTDPNANVNNLTVDINDLRNAFIKRLETKKVKMQSYNQSYNKISVAKADISLVINNLNTVQDSYTACLPFMEILIIVPIQQAKSVKSIIEVMEVNHTELLDRFEALEINFKQSIKPIAAAA
jgi:hypothetical protein